MSGGQLVVLDRLGREVKRFALAGGLATLGSDPRAHIRVMLPSVCPHHATVVVHASQTVVRNIGDGETLVNGQPVSVAALRHGDLLTIGDRSLRWEYDEPSTRRPLAPEPALHVRTRQRGARRRGSGATTGPARSPALQLALELQHRASMPGNAGGKQVAIVQPQRRDTTEQIDQTARSSPQAKRARMTATEAYDADDTPQRRAARGMTQAEMWIASRKTSPRRAAKSLPAPAVSGTFHLYSNSLVAEHVDFCPMTPSYPSLSLARYYIAVARHDAGRDVDRVAEDQPATRRQVSARARGQWNISSLFK
ncbi:proliferation marker protein Ki-67-like [Ostrinia nubilalis]|uniref:proliferation marker protein Ki-67-like n=1 Tax=Ostrinia nubilalis TaxID=29057 RepID=UPI0030822A09